MNKSSFLIRITRDSVWFPGEIILETTRNGEQWNALQLLPSEAEKVIRALQIYLNIGEIKNES